MINKYAWRESKRESNLQKHKLDFIDAGMVIESPYRLDIETERNGELRQQPFASEREVYHDWLENNYPDY